MVEKPFEIGVEDLVTGDRFIWRGKVQHVELDPEVRPYAIWRLIAEEGAPVRRPPRR